MVYTGLLTANEILKHQSKKDLTVSLDSIPQLKDPQVQYSKISPITNPKNSFLIKKLPAYN